MIVYDKEQKEIVIPNGIGNIDIYNNGVEAGYNQGKIDGIDEQKSKLESINITENGTYSREDGYNEIVVDVPDLNGSYDEGYAQGKTDGINEQKSKLESISITENGTYTKEDGYNHIEVNVADLNGSYEEGYEQGQADVAANARVLDVTENGSYASKYTKEDEIVMPFDLWGDDFYSYAYVKNKIYNTGIIPNKNTRLEFWFKPDEGDYTQGSSVVIMNNADSVYGNNFGIFHSTAGDQSYYAVIGRKRVNFNLTNGVLYHIVLSTVDGLVINGEQIFDMSDYLDFSEPLYINGMSNDLNASADGEFGMIKIDDTIIIPTENGFLNQNTNELLEVVYDSGLYKFTEINKPTIEGNLYRTINVNVLPKINVKETGLKFGESTFTDVPEWADFSSVTDMSYMFANCDNLKTIRLINTSNTTDMSNMFYNCESLQTIPLIDTSNVIIMSNMFYNCTSLQTIPQIDTSNVINMSYMFYDFGGIKTLVSLPKFNCQKVTDMSNYFSYYDDGMRALTDVGGWENLKCNWNDDRGLAACPNLTKESCLNILNGLYDFVGNGSTETRTLKVHPNFLAKVGDKISIGTLKGWSIITK